MRARQTPGNNRWPRWVYGVGDEPAPRFSFADERTFLAWTRTALALLAAGVALEALDVPDHQVLRPVLVVLLLVLGCATAVHSWFGRARVERCLRRSTPLPAPRAGPLALGVTVVGVMLPAAFAVT